jgi:uncharacterized damage-inducible protein DinB
MNAQQAVRQQLGFWHGALGGIMGDCGDTLNKPVSGATINSIAAVYAHMVWAEDAIVNGMLQGKPSMYETDGWEAKTGVKHPGSPPSMADWGKTVQMDYAKFKAYSDAVFANTDSYLANVSDAELEQKTQTPIGEQTKGWVVVTLLGTHAPQHTGEIAALKGVHGLKGLPF